MRRIPDRRTIISISHLEFTLSNLSVLWISPCRFLGGAELPSFEIWPFQVTSFPQAHCALSPFLTARRQTIPVMSH